MKKIIRFFVVINLLFLVINCNNDDDIEQQDNNTINLDINEFIWKGLNSYYFWQQNIPDLSDQRFSSQEQLEGFLKPYAEDHKGFFKKLLHTEDLFSWIVDDYRILDQQLQGGVSSTTGMDWRLSYKDSDNNDLIGYVRYVIPNSDADSKGIKRGDLFQKINGQQLTIDNYRELLLLSDSYTIELANYSDGIFSNQGISVLLIKEQLAENPIHIVKTINNGGEKVGYLMYNQFLSSFDQELNTAVASLKADGIVDLVLDLRYNSGGHTSSAAFLSSMITGQFEGSVFTTEKWNNKVNDYFTGQFGDDYFTSRFSNIMNSGETINNLNLNRVIIITSHSTASSSELVINGLNPYIEVILIGEKTVGKTWGSLTLYDSPDYTNKKNINPNHTWAMQPLVVETQNSEGYNNKTGFVPDYEQQEHIISLGILGDPNEPLLAKALEVLSPTTKTTLSKHPEDIVALKYFTDSKKESPIGTNMYIEREMPKMN
ncbi:MAG: peptidase S41 [Flavobacteriaceae bacterium]|nr:peptidase S41 [Flavobacteriaceae bacterium]